MNLIIGLIPALLWGTSPIIATKTGGTPLNQMVGSSYGNLLVGLLTFLIFRPDITFNDFIWCYLGGVIWSAAQLNQFKSFKDLDVSRAMPVSTGLQIIEVTLSGVIFWGNWGTPTEKLIGFISIILLITGISFTCVHDRTSKNAQLNYKAGSLALIIGSFEYTCCNTFPKIPEATGLIGTLPLGMGIFTGALAFSIYHQLRRHQSVLIKKKTFENLTYGIFGGLGGIFYMTSLKLNGAANAFPLTQLNVVISTICGILILHERKDHRELRFTIAGLILMMIAAFMIAKLSS